MNVDVRDTPNYREALALCERFWQPGSGRIVDAAEVHAVPGVPYAVFAGTLVDRLEGMPPTRLCRVDLTTGELQVLTFGPSSDRSPKLSPDGRHVAFQSDRREAGNFQLYLLDAASGAARRTPDLQGWVEYLHWSPDGRQILLGVAGHGADRSGVQGAIPSERTKDQAAAWMPRVESGEATFQWRSLWCYDLASDAVRQLSPANLNVWEGAWCGNASVVAIISPGPGEGLWYTATLQLIDIASGTTRLLYTPTDQLGWPAGSPDGARVAVVEAVCSDRWVVAGDLRLIDVASGQVRKIDTRRIDVGHTEWRSAHVLQVAGLRDFEAVIGVYDANAEAFSEVWRAQDPTVAGYAPKIAAWGENPGDAVLIGEGFHTAPEIATLKGGTYRTARSLDTGYNAFARELSAVQTVCWQAPDGLEIHGWLLVPRHAPAPYPLITLIHGGPVAITRPSHPMRQRPLTTMLLQRGYALFMPNPRGSSARGRDFARRVVGDMGGADTYDYLSGIDHLIKTGVADPKRLGVTGGSYGGYMSAWLITQDRRFAAAVVVSPMTNLTSEHLISNIPHFVEMFMNDHYRNPGGKYFTRSPIMFADRVKTPTLNITGALDRCTPPEEAVQFHNALLEHGVKSVLVTYPQEGHGVRQLPASIDYTARVLEWFDTHLAAASPDGAPR
jgi:dipeptidyl aminopeptidase/acylaminoacyl peptidase